MTGGLPSPTGGLALPGDHGLFPVPGEGEARALPAQEATRSRRHG
jgi:hypothetical protein